MVHVARMIGCLALGIMLLSPGGCKSSQESAPSQYDHIPTAAEARAQTTPPEETAGESIGRFFSNLWPFKEKPAVKPIGATIHKFTVVDPAAKTWERQSVQTLSLDFQTDEGVYTDVDGIDYPQFFREDQIEPLENAVENREWMQRMPRFREGVDLSGRTFYELIVHQDDDQPDLKTIWADPDLPRMVDHPSQQASERLMAFVDRLIHPISNQVDLLGRKGDPANTK